MSGFMMLAQGAANAGTMGLNNHLTRENFKMGQSAEKSMSKFNQRLALDMWEKTNYAAQMEQIKKAGLNPAMMYGKGGQGGTMVNTAAGSREPQTMPMQSMDLANITAQMAQAKLAEAQAKKAEAETANVEADTTNKPKVGANLDASTASLTQGIENQKAQEALTKADKYLREIQGNNASETAVADQNKNIWMADKVWEELRQARNETYISDETMKTKVKLVNTSLVTAIMGNKLTAEQTQKVAQEIAYKATEMQQNRDRISVEQRKVEMQQLRDSMEMALKNAGMEHQQQQDMINNIMKVLGGGMMLGPKETKRYGESEERGNWYETEKRY